MNVTIYKMNWVKVLHRHYSTTVIVPQEVHVPLCMYVMPHRAISNGKSFRKWTGITDDDIYCTGSHGPEAGMKPRKNAQQIRWSLGEMTSPATTKKREVPGSERGTSSHLGEKAAVDADKGKWRSREQIKENTTRCKTHQRQLKWDRSARCR